ncbi:leukocyte elastase inhibitor-like isoform X1 [Anguilla anguilla]|uniref:leukocyte elastase inhibitor-like isoform X1 n=1 Tax=Anguilla anguilla TaxID=7936 RepID=UPI0015ACAFA8|nr:leukocyte elastase inhibitor-like isoform X1 [Anguilla anguilla]XP_035271510.1 leukocyte elastase inhibitor-like isoform X1 [Anguilla anguilla]
MKSLTAANTNFSLDLFKKISESKKVDNIFYSPLSISSALAMVYMGARGNTATQMSKVLGFTKEKNPEVNPGLQQQVQKPQLQRDMLESLHFHKADDDIHNGFSKLTSELNKEGAPYVLSMANRLFGEQSYTFVEKYIMDTKKFYQAELETVDFLSKAEDSRVNINSWVEKQTQEKIKNLLPEGTVDTLTRLVLVNAIYFKGDWSSKFKEADTREVPFKLNKNESKPVQMMHQKAKFGITFIHDVNCQILEMPYVGKELSMLIFLPKEIEDDSTGLVRLETELTYEKLIDWTQPDMMDIVDVNVALPKFKMEETYDLKEILVSMGIEDAFDVSKSDFSGMSPSNELVVSKVVHKAFVEVNEEGTEAAAATAAVMMLRCARPRPITFIADHPFLFFIRHNPTQSILFYGRFCSP